MHNPCLFRFGIALWYRPKKCGCELTLIWDSKVYSKERWRYTVKGSWYREFWEVLKLYMTFEWFDQRNILNPWQCSGIRKKQPDLQMSWFDMSTIPAVLLSIHLCLKVLLLEPLPSWELTYPLPAVTFESMIFLCPFRGIFVSWRVHTVDGSEVRRSPPGMHKLYIMGSPANLNCWTVDWFHQQYLLMIVSLQ